MEIYDFSVAPGKVAEIHCEGTYVYFSAGSAGGADATISLKHDAAGSRVLLLPGQGFRMGEGLIGRRWLVSNYAGAATITGRLVIGSGAIDDNRVTGSVEVIDGEKARTMAGGMFAGSPAVAGVAGQYSNVQLWNPAGSGKNVIVTNTDASSTVVGNAIWLFSTVQLSAAYSFAAVNKKAGSAVPTASIRVENKAAGETYAMGILRNVQMQANKPEPWGIKGALVVPPGYGLNVFNDAVGQTLTANYEWFEENI